MIDDPATVSTLHPIRDLLTERQAALAAAKQERAAAQRTVNNLEKDVANLERALSDEGVVELMVTEHALLRYAERAMGFDPKHVADEIRTHVEPLVRALGDGKYPMPPDLVAVVTNRKVVTVIPA